MSNGLTQKQPRVTLNGRPIYESDFKAMDKDVLFIISTFSTHALKLDDVGTGTVGQLRVVEKTPGLYWIGCGWIVEALDRFRIWVYVKADTNQRDVLMYLEPDQFEGWHLVAVLSDHPCAPCHAGVSLSFQECTPASSFSGSSSGCKGHLYTILTSPSMP